MLKYESFDDKDKQMAFEVRSTCSGSQWVVFISPCAPFESVVQSWQYRGGQQ